MKPIDMEDLDPDLESYWWQARLFSRSEFLGPWVHPFTLDYMREWHDRIRRRKACACEKDPYAHYRHEGHTAALTPEQARIHAKAYHSFHGSNACLEPVTKR